MPSVERFGVSMEPELLAQLDAMVAARGYASRSEAVRDLIRRDLVTAEWTDPEAEVAGSVSIVYDHHAHELAQVLAEVQHDCHECIVCSTHVHMDHDNCLEVIILKGPSAKVTDIANRLISTRGVKHGKLVSSTTGVSVG